MCFLIASKWPCFHRNPPFKMSTSPSDRQEVSFQEVTEGRQRRSAQEFQRRATSCVRPGNHPLLVSSRSGIFTYFRKNWPKCHLLSPTERLQTLEGTRSLASEHPQQAGPAGRLLAYCSRPRAQCRLPAGSSLTAAGHGHSAGWPSGCRPLTPPGPGLSWGGVGFADGRMNALRILQRSSLPCVMGLNEALINQIF